jgi:hypothetical protein
MAGNEMVLIKTSWQAWVNRKCGMIRRIDFDCNRTLQQANGQDELDLGLDLNDDSGQTAQRPTLNLGHLSNIHVGPGQSRNTITPDALEGPDLVIINRDGCFADADDLNDARNHENGQTMVWVKPAEQVTGEQRHVQLLDAVRPATPQLADRQEALVTLGF